MTVSPFSCCAAPSNQSTGASRGWLLRRWLSGGLLCALLTALSAVGCNNAAKPKDKKNVEVIVTTPIADDVIDYQDFTGRLDAFKTADIRARVSGYLTKVPFTEGERVKEGQVLFVVDQRQYQAQYDQAVTQIALNEATLKLAQVTLNRDKATSGGAVSPQTIDQDEAAVAEAIARVNSAKATAVLYKVTLDYATVTAPFDGRISRRYVDPGSDVIADSTLLSTLVTETPVYAYFDVDERTFLDLTKAATPSAGASSFVPLLQTNVLMRLANEDKFERVGVVNFIDNRVTGTTGTIQMRGVFENPQGDLKSGLFARVRMPTSKPYHAVLIPDEAVLSDQGRKYVFLVNEKNEVEYRGGDDLVLGPAIEGLRVIKKGLTEHDRVIVIGMQRVRAGQVVDVAKQDPPKKPESPLAKLTRKEK